MGGEEDLSFSVLSFRETATCWCLRGQAWKKLFCCTGSPRVKADIIPQIKSISSTEFYNIQGNLEGFITF